CTCTTEGAADSTASASCWENVASRSLVMHVIVAERPGGADHPNGWRSWKREGRADHDREAVGEVVDDRVLRVQEHFDPRIPKGQPRARDQVQARLVVAESDDALVV